MKTESELCDELEKIIRDGGFEPPSRDKDTITELPKIISYIKHLESLVSLGLEKERLHRENNSEGIL